MRSAHKTLFVCGFILLCSLSCALPPFSPHFADNEPEKLNAALARITRHNLAPVNITGKPTVFLVAQDPARIVSYDLEADTIRWAREERVTSRLYLGREAIVYFTANELRARSVGDGALLWQRKAIRSQFVGAAIDQGTLFVVSSLPNESIGQNTRRAKMVAIDLASGNTRWQRDTQSNLGAPIARDGLVILPLRQHSIAILDGAEGVELTRIRSGQEALDWVRSEPDGVYYGNRDRVYRLTAQSANETIAAATTASVKMPEALQLAYWWSGYDSALTAYTARDQRRLLWQPVAARGVSLLGGTTVAALYYRYLFGFKVTQRGPKLKWAYNHPHDDYVAATYRDNVITVASSGGDIDFIDAEGGTVVSTVALGFPIVGAAFDLGGFRPDAAEVVHPELGAVLAQSIWDPDKRFEPLKLYCIEALAQLPGDEVSARLVEILTRDGVEPAIYEKVGAMLIARRDAAAVPAYIQALKVQYDYVEETTPRGIDVLATALGSLKSSEAVTPLLVHFGDHETSVTDLAAIVEALAMIKDTRMVAPFRDYLLTYRCAVEQPRYNLVLQRIVDILLSVGGAKERDLLAFVGKDAHTDPLLREYIAKQMAEGAKE